MSQSKVFTLFTALLFVLSACSGVATDGTTTVTSSTEATSSTMADRSVSAADSDEIIADLFADQVSDVQVSGEGIVSRLLSDDTEGDRHQRFILELNSGQSLLIAHNTDIAPYLNGLAVGDNVEFYGEYYYNEQGGGIHWTHHDPAGKHIDGWLLWDGNFYD